jgi:hypothetical protein
MLPFQRIFSYAASNQMLKQSRADDSESDSDSGSSSGGSTASDDSSKSSPSVTPDNTVGTKLTTSTSNHVPIPATPSKTVPLKKRSNVNPETPASKKQRVKKPRRAIPANKEFIPEGEQPSASDVVGGRGGRRYAETTKILLFFVVVPVVVVVASRFAKWSKTDVCFCYLLLT